MLKATIANEYDQSPKYQTQSTEETERKRERERERVHARFTICVTANKPITCIYLTKSLGAVLEVMKCTQLFACLCVNLCAGFL
jgi:hypothetical protein